MTKTNGKLKQDWLPWRSDDTGAVTVQTVFPELTGKYNRLYYALRAGHVKSRKVARRGGPKFHLFDPQSICIWLADATAHKTGPKLATQAARKVTK